MTISNVSSASVRVLPKELETAQKAIELPEVQEMLRRLSEHKLGIFMPHMHDEETGEFQSLPDDVIQVESELEVTFQPTDAIAKQSDRFLPVGWFWRSDASTPLAVCEMAGDEGHVDAERSTKHKMKDTCNASSERDQTRMGG